MPRALPILLLVLLACGDDPMATPDGGPEALVAVLSAPRGGDPGEPLTLDASASTGAVAFTFELGDGRRVDDEDGVVEVSWDAPGRYAVVLVATSATGATRNAGATVTITAPPVHVPEQSGTLARLAGDRFAVVVTDDDQVTVATLDGGSLALERRIPTPRGPETVSAFTRGEAEWLAVTCHDTLLLVRSDESERHEVPMPFGSQPHAALADAEGLWVTLQGTGELARVEGASEPFLVARYPVVPDARAQARLPDGRLAVSRWRSADSGAEVALFDPATQAVETVDLRVDPQPASDTENGGVPSYLDALLVAPDGERMVVSGLQANFAEGRFLDGRDHRSDTMLRAVIATVERDGDGWTERFSARRQLDDRGLVSAGVFTERGDFLFVATRGARTVERIDMLSGSAAGSILALGYAPDGLTLSADDRTLVVHASLDRRLEVYDVSDFTALPVPLSMLSTVDVEPLPADVLRGKQLFNDAADPRLTRDAYIACAHCHLEGDSDHRVWDFTQRGEGLRRTPPLFARMELAPFHWTGNFDELQDFEIDIREHFDGLGLMAPADYAATAASFGAAKAGLSEDLDALAAYLRTLDRELASPQRSPDGSRSAAAERGAGVFEAAGCATCHSGPAYTDSGFVDGAPVLHDVGTFGAGSGSRLGEPLTGLDTPSLLGLWHQPRYLHDGSAPSLEAVLTTRNPEDRHGVTSTLSDAELADLVAFLESL